MKLQAAVVNFDPSPGSVDLREVPVPEIAETDVLVEVGAVGVCGSDLHQWTATHSWPVNYPVVLGHEFAGTIVETGSRVTGWSAGDRVVSETVATIDDASPMTRRGLYNLDPSRKGFGYGVDGAMTRFVRVPERCLHHIPDSLPFEKAALTEPCCVAYNATVKNARIEPGDRILVIGPGPIGILCGAMARLCGPAGFQKSGGGLNRSISRSIHSSRKTSPCKAASATTGQSGNGSLRCSPRTSWIWIPLSGVSGVCPNGKRPLTACTREPSPRPF